MEGNSIKTFQNLCKIFEMRIRLDNAKGTPTPEEVSDNYEKYAKRIDDFYNEEFQKELKILISPKETLDKEKDRLEKLINLLEDRLEKRSDLAGEYHRTTGKYIKNLQLIVSDSELKNKKERLSLITKYLDTTKEIDDIKESIVKLQSDLEEEKNKKEEYLEKNKTLEDELYSTFVTSVNVDKYYSEIEEEKILDILNDVSKKASETKETLDITKESVESLLSSGMNDEYESYVEEANKNYSLWKDRELILNIYKLVINFEDEFTQLLNKRISISQLLEERKGISLDKVDILLPFEKLMDEQNKILGNEKEILDNIVNYTSRIDFKEERLKELEEVIKEPEILAILKEYNLSYDDHSDTSIDNLDNDAAKEEKIVFADNDVQEQKMVLDDVESSSTGDNNIEVKEYNPYMIVSIDDAPATLNVNLAKLKGASVREKVTKKLNTDSGNVLNDIEPKEDIQINNVDENPNVEIPNLEYNPVLSEEKDLSSDVNTIDNVTNDNNASNSNNSFWTPVSDSKIETSEFPNINIPVLNNNLNVGEDNFGFPEVNN